MPTRLVALGGGPDIFVDRPLVLVGRHPECDVQLDSCRVSRIHCCLSCDHDELLVRVAQRGRQHEGSLEVLAVKAPPTLRQLERAEARALPSQQPAEAAAGVEARQAAPVDRPEPGDERRPVAVADERVVADRGLAHRRASAARPPAATPVPAASSARRCRAAQPCALCS